MRNVGQIQIELDVEQIDVATPQHTSKSIPIKFEEGPRIIPKVYIVEQTQISGFILSGNTFGSNIKHFITTRGIHNISGLNLYIHKDYH